jgi:hypothetical protein
MKLPGDAVSRLATNFWPNVRNPRRLRFPLGEPRRRLGAIKGTPTFFLTSDHPALPFGFEIGKIVKYAGLNSDQLDLILGKNLARLLRIERKPSAPKTIDIAQI